jgi:hypothetical protein
MRSLAICNHRAIEGAINMAANRPLNDLNHGIVVVPLPPSVIEMLGCRPGTTIRLHRVDGQLKALPITVSTGERESAPNASTLWETYGQWWKARGSNAA